MVRVLSEMVCFTKNFRILRKATYPTTNRSNTSASEHSVSLRVLLQTVLLRAVLLQTILRTLFGDDRSYDERL
jgi:hypothetical protein